MKKLWCSLALLSAIAILCVFSSVRLERILDELELSLRVSGVLCEIGAFEQAKTSIDVYNETLERNEAFFMLFVRRDLYYSASMSVKALALYATENHKQDFKADVSKALEQLDIIRHTTVKPF